MRLAGIEPTTPWFVAKYSIQLSYSREALHYSMLDDDPSFLGRQVVSRLANGSAREENHRAVRRLSWVHSTLKKPRPTLIVPKPLGPAQDYLIFHPCRVPFQVRGTARVDGHLQPWAGRVWADRSSRGASKNEDPFIWTPSWLYSYCHATQLRRTAQQKSFVQEGSRLFFCEAEAAKRGTLKVDTVFQVATRVPWASAGVPPSDFAHFGRRSPEWLRHLVHGTLRPGVRHAHVGRLTYVAQMAGASFLPMEADQFAFSIAAPAVMPHKARRIMDANSPRRSSYPVELDRVEADRLHAALRAAPLCVTAVDP